MHKRRRRNGMNFGKGQRGCGDGGPAGFANGVVECRDWGGACPGNLWLQLRTKATVRQGCVTHYIRSGWVEGGRVVDPKFRNGSKQKRGEFKMKFGGNCLRKGKKHSTLKIPIPWRGGSGGPRAKKNSSRAVCRGGNEELQSLF